MSENPEAFNVLRKAAYSFVNQHGKDADALQRVCEDHMRRWRATARVTDMSMQDERALIRSVVRWTMNRYNRPRYRPKRSREERAGYFLIAPEALEMSKEQYGKASIRGAARITEQSKSTVARHLLRQGIAPRRDKKIRQLAKTSQKLVRILDETFDRRAAGIVQLDRLSSALWNGTERRNVPVTTQASRRKKLQTILAEISSAGLGYSLFAIDNVCGVQRGRRFPSARDAMVWVEEEKRLNRYAPIRLPKSSIEPAQDYFWADPIVVDVMSIIDMSFSNHFYPVENMRPIFRFEKLLLDIQPVLPWIERAYHSYAGDNMADNLSNLSSMITDPGVRRATSRLAKILGDLTNFVGPFPRCYDAFQMVDFVLGVMDKTAETSPESFAKLAYIRDWFESNGEYYDDARERLSSMLELEKAGEWRAPGADVLTQYLPMPNEMSEPSQND